MRSWYGLSRPSSAVRPVRPWPYHFFGRKWFWPDPFSGRLYISFFFLPGNFSADKILSNNIDNLSVHRSMFCLPLGVKHSRYINMILKLTPLLTTVTIIKRLSFEVRVHQRLL